MIPIFEPYLEGNEKKYLMDCIDSNWVSSQGDYIIKLEQALAEYHNMKHAIVTSNCTTAIHLSLKVLKIGSGDEVICPNLTFIAPANMVILSGAKLVLVDIHPETLTIDPNLIEKKITKKTKAIIVVHQFGHSAHMDEILLLAKKYDLRIIEDNAESIGAKYKNKLLGTFGDISTNSFFGNKIITSGEGGALLTNNADFAIKCKELRDHGMNHKKKYHYVDLGYNYRMTNMQAAVGLAQMEKLDVILELRKNQMDYYYNKLSNIEGVALRKYADWCSPVHWMLTILVGNEHNRDELINFMWQNNIECRPMINPVNKADHLAGKFDELFPVSDSVAMQSVHLPSSSYLNNSKINLIVDKIRAYFEQR